VKDIHDVIKHAKFGDDRLRGSVVVAGEISAFPIDFAGRPYNTLTLPCERVIHKTGLGVELYAVCYNDLAPAVLICGLSRSDSDISAVVGSIQTDQFQSVDQTYGIIFLLI